MICTTCNRPAERGYRNIAANEQCCDPCHGPHLTQHSEAMRRFFQFHGTRKARKYIESTRYALTAADVEVNPNRYCR